MSTPSNKNTEARPLNILGITELEEEIYRFLLARSGATTHEIAKELALTPGKCQRLLDLIEMKGLTTHTPERPRRYISVLPDVALKALLLRHRESLSQVEAEIQDLQSSAGTIHAQDHMIELVVGREASREIYNQLHQSARLEVCSFISSPILISRLDVSSEIDGSAQREAQIRGVEYRSIADNNVLTLPGLIDRIRNDIRAGEKYRVYPELPLKVTIMDKNIAFIPLNPRSPNFYSLLVRSSPLLDGLHALFEVLWERSSPIEFNSFGLSKVSTAELQLPELSEELIGLMTAGLNDKRIAAELGISASTLKRRISAIMKAYHVRTRFQLGCITNHWNSGQGGAHKSGPEVSGSALR